MNGPAFDAADRLLVIVAGALDLVEAAERARALAEAERDVWRAAYEALVAQMRPVKRVGSLRQRQAWTEARKAAHGARIRAAWKAGRYDEARSNGHRAGGVAGGDSVGADIGDGQ